MLSDCCIHLISLPTTAQQHFVLRLIKAGFAVLCSECRAKLQCVAISSGLWHGLTRT